MSQFRTILPIPVSEKKIDHQDQILGIGSCFVENIGRLLAKYKFPFLLNPFGILYNPISIQQSIELLLSENTFTQKDLIENHGIWYSFAHHGSFSHPEPAQVLRQINQSLAQARIHLKTTKTVLITLGTAAVFVHKKTDKVVANCHKFPATHFEKKQLSVEEIQTALKACVTQLKTAYPHISIILTVSPVRHIRDGIIKSQRSKAKLLLAAAQLEQTIPTVNYFPAYELMMDDLRDYRFYEKDLIHPNQQAIDYIWEAFKTTYCSAASLQLLIPIKKVLQASQHRPFHHSTAAHQRFIQQQLQAIEKLEQQHPFLNFAQEKLIFKEQQVSNEGK